MDDQHPLLAIANNYRRLSHSSILLRFYLLLKIHKLVGLLNQLIELNHSVDYAVIFYCCSHYFDFIYVAIGCFVVADAAVVPFCC